MALTKQQNEAVESRGENLLVSASAGSGKTTAMVNRIISLLKEGAFIGDMLIITFTKAAAADMRDKISRALVDMRGSDESFERQLRALPGASIGTIDSWCSGLVRNYFYAADTNADYELISERENKELCSRIIDGKLDDFLGFDETSCALYDSFIYNRKDDAFKKFIYSLIQFAVTRVDPVQWFESCCDQYASDLAEKEIRSELEIAYRNLSDKLSALAKEAKTAGYDKLVEYCGCLESSLVNCTDLERFYGKRGPEYIALNEKLKSLKSGINDYIKRKAEIDSFEELKEVEKQARAAAGLARSVYAEMCAEKKKNGLADYDDLERTALNILNSEGVGDEIRALYKYVFVDEYQDVNPLQDELVKKAAGGELFIVGDVKQSIYAFRRSDPDIFLEKFFSPENHGISKVIQFNENFRSGNAVIDFSNAVFSRAMTLSFGGIDYGSARLVFAKSDGGGEAEVRLLAVPDEKASDRPEIYDVKMDTGEKEKNSRMAGFIAAGIADRLSTPDEKGRRVKEGDIAVLYRSESDTVRQVFELLKKSGINVFLRKKNYFSSAWEIRALDNFLKLLAFGLDETALAGYLLSPLCSIGEAELYKATALYQGSFSEKVAECARNGEGETAGKIKKAFDMLERYGEIARDASVPEIISGIIAETGYAEKLLASGNGAGAAEILEKYTEYLSRLKCASDVSDYVRYLENGDVQFESAAPENSLKIMTEHMAKGLQFPYVFLVECDRKFNLTDAYKRWLCDRDLGLCLKTGDAENQRNNFMTEAARRRTIKKRKEEEMRLLYVAMTRAEKGLYCYAYDKRKKRNDEDNGDLPQNATCFLDWIAPVAEGITRVFSDVAFDVSETVIQEREKSARDCYECAEKIRSSINYVYPYSSDEIKTTVTGLAGEETVSAVTRSEDAEELMEKGTRLHAVMEKIDFEAPFDREKEKFADDITGSEEMQYIRAAHEKVGKLIRGFGGKVYREQNFVVNTQDGKLVQGVVDLMAVNDGRAMILDYKLAGEKNICKESYFRQINLYADAAESILGVNVTDMYLYSFSGKTAKKVERRPHML